MYLHPAFAEILSAETRAEHLRLARSRQGAATSARVRTGAAPVPRRRVRIRGGPPGRFRFRLIRS